MFTPGNGEDTAFKNIMNEIIPMSRLKPALPALIVALAILARLIPGPRTIDDAFITFRYARNILAGQGFVYNPGEAVLGTTTPLYTLLMAGLGALTGGVAAPFPQLALLVNALADAATCLMLVRAWGGGWVSSAPAWPPPWPGPWPPSASPLPSAGSKPASTSLCSPAPSPLPSLPALQLN